MKNFLLLAFLLNLSACATQGPEKATSIEDYCTAVSMEADKYLAAKTDGLTKDDQMFLILRNYSNQYPAREVHAMIKVLNWVYQDVTPVDIKARCVEQRQSNTWFEEPTSNLK